MRWALMIWTPCPPFDRSSARRAFGNGPGPKEIRALHQPVGGCLQEEMKMKICNEDIRNEIKEAGLFLWQVADRLGINDTYFQQKLRYEFSP